jgi:hypothetical protein
MSGIRYKALRFKSPYLCGASNLLDIFGVTAAWPRFGSSRSDRRCLNIDFRTVGKDFATVLSNNELLSKESSANDNGEWVTKTRTNFPPKSSKLLQR